MHEVEIIKTDRFTKKIVKKTTEKFFSVYNARRRVSEIEDLYFDTNKTGRIIIQVRLNEMAA